MKSTKRCASAGCGAAASAAIGYRIGRGVGIANGAAAELTKLCEGSPFGLTILSNRGTLVWPTASIYTECVDYLRARFEPRPDAKLSQSDELASQDEPLKLARRVAERFVVSEYQLLRTFDGVKGYSLAQGQ